MRSSKPILGIAGAIVLLAGLAAGAAGQEASPEPSPEPSPAVSPEPVEAGATTEPLPVADYWVEWLDHKHAYYARASSAIENAKRASKPARWYRALVGVHKDELKWLANHRAQYCYQYEYEKWRGAVEDLHVIHTKALRFVRAGKAAGVRRTDKQRRDAMKRLDRTLLDLADCDPPVPDAADATPSRNPLVGTWLGVWRFVDPVDGVDRAIPARYTMARDGRFISRNRRDNWCRALGHGFVPLTCEGRGEFVTDGTPQFHGRGGSKCYCYPRGGGRVFTHEAPPGEHPARYHAAYDVIQFGGTCMWRAKTGSPKDCKAFWRGTPTPVPAEDVEAPVEDGVAPEEEEGTAAEDEAAAPPEEGED